MNVTIKPTILKTLRENRRIPTDSMAEKLKMTKESYEAYEENEVLLTIEQAGKIAKIFKRNWTVFLLKEPPEKPRFKNDNRSSSLQRSGIGLKTYDALEEANYLLNFIVAITDDKTNKIPALSADQPASALASEFRKSINCPVDKEAAFRDSGQALNYWIKQLGNIGINVSRFPLGDGDGVRAFSIHKENKAIVVLNSDDSNNGKIFSLFHEVAHILRRNTGICDLHRDENAESYCNNFASEILIPSVKYQELIKELVINNDTALEQATELSKKLKVSRLTVLTRFLRSQLITKTRYDELYWTELASYQSYKEKQEAVRSAAKAKGGIKIHPYALKRARLGRLFTNEIFDAMHQSRVSPFQASKYLGFSVGKIGSFNEWVGQNEGS